MRIEKAWICFRAMIRKTRKLKKGINALIFTWFLDFWSKMYILPFSLLCNRVEPNRGKDIFAGEKVVESYRDIDDLRLRQFCRWKNLWIFSGHWWYAAKTILQAKKSLNLFAEVMGKLNSMRILCWIFDEIEVEKRFASGKKTSWR